MIYTPLYTLSPYTGNRILKIILNSWNNQWGRGRTWNKFMKVYKYISYLNFRKFTINSLNIELKHFFYLFKKFSFIFKVSLLQYQF